MSHFTPRRRPAMHSAAAAITLPARAMHVCHHMRVPQSYSPSLSAWRQHSRTYVRSWHGYAVASYTPKLPSWVRSRLPEMPEGKHRPSLACSTSASILHGAPSACCFLHLYVPSLLGKHCVCQELASEVQSTAWADGVAEQGVCCLLHQ